MQRLILAGILIILVACGSLFPYLHFLNRQAEFVVHTAFELTENKQPRTLANIQKQFGSQLKLDECSGSDCVYTVVVSNRILAALHVLPYSELQSDFWARDGVVIRNMLDLTTEINHRYRIVAHVQTDFCKNCRAVDVHPWDGASPLDTNGIIGIGDEASDQSRRIVLSINTDCLTRFGGCHTVADLLPAVWKQTADRKIICMIPNDRGMIEKPADWP